MYGYPDVSDTSGVRFLTGVTTRITFSWWRHRRTRRWVRNRENSMTTQVAEKVAELDINDIKVVSAEVIDQALAAIDGALAQMVRRELVSAGEVSDLLLDVRNLLTTAVRG